MSSFDPRLGNAVLISQLLGVGTGQNPGANQTGAQQSASKAERDKDDDDTTTDANGQPTHKHGAARGAGQANTANPAVQGDSSGRQGQGGSQQGGQGTAGLHAESSASAMSPGEVQKLALAGLSGIDDPSAQRAQGNNKFGTDQAILQNPPPMPPDAPRMTPRTGQLYQAMSADISQALAAGGAKQTGSDLKDATSQFKNMATQLNDQTLSSAQGAQDAGQATGTLAGKMGRDLMSMISGDSLAAFLMLNVVNRQSGKETLSALQDMMTQARNNQIEAQIKEQEAAAEKAKEALKKQQLMKKLGPLIEAIVTVIMLAVTALTFGATAPITMLVIGATVAGFIAGGAIGGAKNGKGFDFGAAMTGAGIGGAIASLATAPVKAILMSVIKVAEAVVERVLVSVGLKAATKAGTGKALEAGAAS